MEAEAHSCVGGDGRARQVRYFWLCNSCSRTMTLDAKKKEGIEIVPLPSSSTASRAAP
jgi:hypothetical protein